MSYSQQIIILNPTHSIHAANVSEFKQLLLDAIADHESRHILIDLASVDLIDSAALLSLVQGSQDASRCGKQLALCHVNSEIRMVLELTQLEKSLVVFPDEQAFFGFIEQSFAA